MVRYWDVTEQVLEMCWRELQKRYGPRYLILKCYKVKGCYGTQERHKEFNGVSSRMLRGSRVHDRRVLGQYGKITVVQGKQPIGCYGLNTRVLRGLSDIFR